MTTNRSIIKTDINDEGYKVDSLLPGLPDKIAIGHIFSKLSPKEYGLFAQASSTTEKATAFLRLMTSAVYAEPESYQQTDETKLAAIAILKRHPELLFRKGYVTDHYGRKIHASPYQLFLGSFDVWALRKVHEEILPYIEGGEALAQAHFQAQFPNCPWPFDPNMGEEMLYDDRNIKQVAEVLAQLEIIKQKITADPCTNGLATLDETKNAVADLCQIFAPQEGDVIRTGLHFPLGIMKEIFKLYDVRRSAFINNQPNSWNAAKLAYFSREVIGAVEAALTSVDGQCCKYGFGNLNMAKGPDRRDGLFCRRPQGIPQNLAPLEKKLGRTVFVDPYDGYTCALGARVGVFDWYNKNGGGAPGRRVRWHGGGPSCAGGVGLLDVLWKTKAETYGGCYAATQRRANTSSR